LTGTALSHFGSGLLALVLPRLFRTPPGFGLLVRGITNEVNDNAVPLDGVVETDWSPDTFTMNWKLVRPDVRVQFKKGDAVCMLQPFALDLLERFDCSFESYDALPADVRAPGFRGLRAPAFGCIGTCAVRSLRNSTRLFRGPLSRRFLGPLRVRGRATPRRAP
jgi:hypothetical protein